MIDDFQAQLAEHFAAGGTIESRVGRKGPVWHLVPAAVPDCACASYEIHGPHIWSMAPTERFSCAGLSALDRDRMLNPENHVGEKLDYPYRETVQEMSFRLSRYDRNHRRQLVESRRKRGLTQEDVAKRLGVSTRWVNRIERYDSDPRLSELRRYTCAIYADLLPEEKS